MDYRGMIACLPIVESYGLRTIAQLHTILLFLNGPTTIQDATGLAVNSAGYKRHLDKIHKFTYDLNHDDKKRLRLIEVVSRDHLGVATYALTTRGRRLRDEMQKAILRNQ